MGADTKLEEPAFDELNADEAQFSGLAQRHRRELPATACYLRGEQEEAYLPLTIDVLRISSGSITEVFTFHDDQFPRLGLPERLSIEGAEHHE